MAGCKVLPKEFFENCGNRNRDTRMCHNVIVRPCDIEREWGGSPGTVAMRNPDSKSAEFVKNIREWSEIYERL